MTLFEGYFSLFPFLFYIMIPSSVISTISSVISTISLAMSKAQRIKNRRILLGFSLMACFLVMRGVWRIQLFRYEVEKPLQQHGIKHIEEGGGGGDGGLKNGKTDQEKLPCYHLPGASDVLVVMKTTATETHLKIPIHLSTTFRCTPNFILYSDMAEEISNQPIYDILQSYPNTTLTANEDFRIYDEIQQTSSPLIREAKGKGEDQELLARIAKDKEWELSMLDRWKYLPMLSKSFEYSPDSKWFVFIEDESALIWSNLLLLLSHLDSTKPYFLGNRLYLDSIEFASSGSGIILSNAALKQFHQSSHGDDGERRRGRFEALTREHGEGDVILSLGVRNESGVELEHVWPHLQGESVGNLDFGERGWCEAVISFGGMEGVGVKGLWDFEQRWLERGVGENTQSSHSTSQPPQLPPTPLLHRDIYTTFIAPYIQIDQHDWDNQNPSESSFTTIPPSNLPALSPAGCWAVCMDTPECIQWWFSNQDGVGEAICKISKELRLGKRKDCGGKCVAGWVGERIGERVRGFEEGVGCKNGGGWSLPGSVEGGKG